MITNIDKKSTGLDFKLAFFWKKFSLAQTLLDNAFVPCYNGVSVAALLSENGVLEVAACFFEVSCLSFCMETDYV